MELYFHRSDSEPQSFLALQAAISMREQLGPAGPPVTPVPLSTAQLRQPRAKRQLAELGITGLPALLDEEGSLVALGADEIAHFLGELVDQMEAQGAGGAGDGAEYETPDEDDYRTRVIEGLKQEDDDDNDDGIVNDRALREGMSKFLNRRKQLGMSTDGFGEPAAGGGARNDRRQKKAKGSSGRPPPIGDSRRNRGLKTAPSMVDDDGDGGGAMDALRRAQNKMEAADIDMMQTVLENQTTT